MKIRISKKTWEALEKPLTEWGIDKQKFGYSGTSAEIDLHRHSKERLNDLKKIFDSNRTVYATKTASRDIALWLEVSSDKKKAATAVGRTLKQIHSLLITYIQNTPHQHLYTRQQEGDDSVLLCYWIESIIYCNGMKECPDWISIHLVYEELGKVQKSQLSVYADGNIGLTAKEILAGEGYSVETPILRADYETFVEEFLRIKDSIGTRSNFDLADAGRGQWY